MKPKVSIVIPAYNVEKYIGRCIQSIQNQTMTEIQIIVVNDCSTDSTVEILERLKSADDRLFVYTNEKNMGPMWNRDFGARKAQGDYIIYCDGDDTIPPKAVEQMYNAIISNNSDIVFGNIDYICCNGKKEKLHNILPYGDDRNATCKALLEKKCRHELWGKIYKRSLLTDFKYQVIANFNNNEDELILYQFLNNISKASVINETVYNYYQVIGSSTQKKFPQRAIENVIFVQNKKRELFESNSMLNIHSDRSITRAILALYCSPHQYERTIVDNLLQKYGMTDYLTFEKIWNTFSFYEVLKVYLKLVFQSKLGMKSIH